MNRMKKSTFKKKWEEADDYGRLCLLENNRHLNMVVMLSDDETYVLCDSDDEIFLRFDYCQGNDIVVRENLSKLRIKYEVVS